MAQRNGKSNVDVARDDARRLARQPSAMSSGLGAGQHEQGGEGGCEDHEALAVTMHIVDTCKNLKFSGLMMIGKLGDPIPALLQETGRMPC
jgi:uncharacterized pyridoxal phosphate-containing UPF0001 family protein